MHVFIRGLFIHLVISNYLEVTAQTPEDTAPHSTQKYRKKIKLQYIPQHGFLYQMKYYFHLQAQELVLQNMQHYQSTTKGQIQT